MNIKMINKIKGLKFSDAFQTAEKFINQLKNKVNVIIIAYHGGFQKSLKNSIPFGDLEENEGSKLISLPKINALVTGHTHFKISAIINGIPITQPGYQGEDVGLITLNLNKYKKVTEKKSQLIPSSTAKEEPNLKRMMTPWKQKTDQWLARPLCSIKGNMKIKNSLKASLYGCPYLELINQIQMKTARTDISLTSFSFNTFGFKDKVSIKDVIKNYPFPNSLVVELISGKDLKKALERCANFFVMNKDKKVTINKSFPFFYYDFYSGINYTFNLKKPIGKRVEKILYHHKEVKENQQLKIALNQYRGVGGGGYSVFSAKKIIHTFDKNVQELIIDFLRTSKKIKAIEPKNLKIIK